MEPRPRLGGDELRVRALLHTLTARPFGHQHQEHHVPDKPIVPTRIIPAGVPLPARPPEPGEAPPWRPPPPASPIPPPPPPAPLEVRHVHEVVLVFPEPKAERKPLWTRLWDRLFTWRMVVAILAALIPWADGDSPVGIWAGVLHDARTEAGIGAAYIINAVAIAAAWALDRTTGRLIPRFFLVTATVGALGVLDWFDPITLITGVTR